MFGGLREKRLRLGGAWRLERAVLRWLSFTCAVMAAQSKSAWNAVSPASGRAAAASKDTEGGGGGGGGG